MPEFDLVIRHADVATESDRFSTDIGISNGRITALEPGLSEGAQEIDVKDRLVMPGGVDSHCHVEQISSNGIWTADDWFTATRSAACGGTTTIIPFACQHRGQSLRDVVKAYHDLAGPKAAIDYAFHLIVSDPTDQVLGQELPALIKDGYTSFKIYLTYDALMLTDRQFLDVLAVARRDGAMVMVHAENNDMIKWMAERLLHAGLRAPKFHAVARPMLVEREATHRSIALAELVDVPILIVHVSGSEAIEQIRWAIRPIRKSCGKPWKLGSLRYFPQITRRIGLMIRKENLKLARTHISNRLPMAYRDWKFGCLCCSPKVLARDGSRINSLLH